MTVPTSAPTLTDGTVTLRAHRAEDVPRLVEQCVDPLSVLWTTVPTPYDAAEGEKFALELVPGWWADGTEYCFALDVDGRFGGSLSLRPEVPGRLELAYGAHPDVRGTGALERAVRLLLEWGFEEAGARTVVWRANTGNWASRRLAYKVGFTVDGTLRGYLSHRGELRDAWVGTLLRDDPREPQRPWLSNPVLEGDGVRLRPFRDDDVPRVAEGLGDADVQHWLAFMPRDPGLADAEAYVEQVTERLATGHTITWAFSSSTDDTDALLGVVGIYRVAEEPELGYWTHPDARGRGLTTAAGAVAVRHAFEDLGLARLAAYVSVPNAASARVLERLGFQRTGVRREAARTGAGEVVDLAGYDLLALERNANASTANPASDSAIPTSSGER